MVIKAAKKHKLFFFSLIAIILVDQLIKYFIRHSLQPGQTIFIISHVQNTGSVFGLMQNSVLALIWLSVCVIGLVVYFYDKIKYKATTLFTSFILAGTLSNLYDRIAYGHVIDFINLRVWPVFNIADSALCVGVIGLVVWFLRRERKK